MLFNFSNYQSVFSYYSLYFVVISPADSTTTSDMDKTVCYGSDDYSSDEEHDDLWFMNGGNEVCCCKQSKLTTTTTG